MGTMTSGREGGRDAVRAGSRRRLAIASIVVGSLGVWGCGGSSPPPPVEPNDVAGSPIVSVHEDIYSATRDPRETLRDLADLGTKVVRIDLRWDQVALSPPVEATDPADPAYNWGGYDRVVDAAEAVGVEVMFAVYGTPPWAADPAALATALQPFGARPLRTSDFGAFATAAARRYSSRGVRRWEAWNEPNIPIFLAPQFERRGDQWVAVSPQIYSELLKAFYAAVKAVEPDAIVAGGVMSPAGDCGATCPAENAGSPPSRVRPHDFVTALGREGLRPPMDVVSHHPYPITKPRDRTPPGRSYVDLYNLDVLISAIDAGYLRGKPLWLTEYGFPTESVKEYPTAFTQDEQAAFIADAFGRVRGNRRVQLMTYYLFRDHAGWRSGLIDQAGNPKPGRDAFAMPLVVVPGNTPSAGVELVGQVRPTTGPTTVTIEWRDGDEWRKLTSAKTAKDGTYSVTVTPEAVIQVRSSWAGRTRSGAERSWTGVPVEVRLDGAPGG